MTVRKYGSGDWQGSDGEGYANVLSFYQVNEEQDMIQWNQELSNDVIWYVCDKNPLWMSYKWWTWKGDGAGKETSEVPEQLSKWEMMMVWDRRERVQMMERVRQQKYEKQNWLHLLTD